MKTRSLCILAMSAPLLLGAAWPHARPIAPRAAPADIVEANFLTRLLGGNEPSPRRRAAPKQRIAIPEPPAAANVPVPLPRPAAPSPADAAGTVEAQSQMASEEPAKPPPASAPKTASKTEEQQSHDKAAAAGQPNQDAGRKSETPPQSEPLPPTKNAAEGGGKAPENKAAEGNPPADKPIEAQAPVAAPTGPQANPPAIADVPTPLAKPQEQDRQYQAVETPAQADTADKPEGKLKEEEKAAAPPPPPPPPLVKEDPAELKACLADLAAIGAKFEPTDPIDEGKGCGIENPIEVSEVLPGVNLGGAVMRCKTALTMAHWLKDTVQPALNIAMPGRRITGVAPGSTYACRLRNSAATGKISEHARGNAYDVAAFKLDNGERLEMKPRTEDSTLEGAFQRTATAGACLHFTTVLSPGSDAAHETHLHLDVMERERGYRYCR